MQSDISSELDKVIASDHSDPFRVLGPHVLEDDPSSLVIRAFLPLADSVLLVKGQEKKFMYKMRKEGLFEIVVAYDDQAYDYFYEAKFHKDVKTFRDPYLFPPHFSEYDRHLYNNGCHYNIYDKMGSHPLEIDGIKGVIFRVWAPNARRVSVIGNFNYWDGRCHQMRHVGSSGIWELFIPDLCQGEIYKYEIKTGSGTIIEKSDPFQFHGELPPKSASIVWGIDDYKWQDNKWLQRRTKEKLQEKPVSVYEVHAGSWQRDPSGPERYLSYIELADNLIPYVKSMGFTHIEFMPLMEHPLDESLGYQTTGFYSVTSRYGLPQDFMYFVDQCHQNEIGVILDWSPSSFSPDGHSLVNFDGTDLYENGFTQPAEYWEPQKLRFNFGRKEVANFLIANALFWLDKFHIDGIRIDSLSSILYWQSDDKEPSKAGPENIEAIDFIKHLNSTVKQYYPDTFMIAEEKTNFYGLTQPLEKGGLGFDFKWFSGWSDQILSYLGHDPLYRKYHHNNLTFSLHSIFAEKYLLPLSHNEVVNGKKSLLEKVHGDKWQRFANLRSLYFFLWTHPGKKLLFMGGEIGQQSEWDYQTSLDWQLAKGRYNLSLQYFVEKLNKLYLKNKAFWEVDTGPEGFQWLDFKDVNNSIISYARFSKNRGDHLICLLNLTPQVHYDYQVGVFEKRKYKEILSTDMGEFGGSNIHNPDIKTPVDQPFAEAPYHIRITVPPLAGVIFKPV